MVNIYIMLSLYHTSISVCGYLRIELVDDALEPQHREKASGKCCS